MESIIQELNFAFIGSAPVPWPGDPKTEVKPANIEPLLPTTAAIYIPRVVISSPPEVEPREHLKQSPVYELKEKLRVQPTIEPQHTVTPPDKILPRKSIHEAPRPQSDPWALLPESDLPATPEQLSSTAKSQATLPGETHAVAATKPRSTKSMLDLFV